ncbi:AraC family transcriptional regulator [Devosia sp.]|uniref:AraC family transcriptional regulator n=1 Tax=Devosia sp. TaxID=1871048 RepID=UPI0032636088
MDAWSLYQEFAPQPPRILRVDQHYLLYAARGAMRLEAEGQSWSLPPARAALISAGAPITVTLGQHVTVCSVLFDTGFVPPPAAPLTVFDMSPLARELVLECGQWGKGSGALSPYASQMFLMLATVAWKLAKTPSHAVMPAGRSQAVREILRITDAMLAEPLAFDALAARVAMTPRSLSRRLMQELGMSWSQALRRLRMMKAIEMLASSDEPVTSIAMGVGYASLSAFNAAFREFAGATPTHYRASYRAATPQQVTGSPAA